MSLSCVLGHDRTYASDVATYFLQLAGVGKLLCGTLHTQTELCPQQAFELFAELGGIFAANFAGFHGIFSLSADLASNECCRDRQLGSGQTKCFACHLFADTFHFVQDFAWLDLGYPVLRVTFTATHTYFRRFLGNRLVREYTCPDTAATLDRAVDCTTCGFDRASSQTATTCGFQTELTERDLRTASSQASITAFVLFAVPSARRLQHSYSPSAAGAASGLRAAP